MRDQLEWQLGQERGEDRESLRLRAVRELHRRADGDAGSHRAGGQSCFNLEVSPYLALPRPLPPLAMELVVQFPVWDRALREHGRRT